MVNASNDHKFVVNSSNDQIEVEAKIVIFDIFEIFTFYTSTFSYIKQLFFFFFNFTIRLFYEFNINIPS